MQIDIVLGTISISICVSHTWFTEMIRSLSHYQIDVIFY